LYYHLSQNLKLVKNNDISGNAYRIQSGVR